MGPALGTPPALPPAPESCEQPTNNNVVPLPIENNVAPSNNNYNQGLQSNPAEKMDENQNTRKKSLPKLMNVNSAEVKSQRPFVRFPNTNMKNTYSKVKSIDGKEEDNFWMIPRKSWATIAKKNLYPMYLHQDDSDLYRFLMRYVPQRRQLELLGYPYESMEYPYGIKIFKKPIRSPPKIDGNVKATKETKSGDKISLGPAKKCVRCGETFHIPKTEKYLYGDGICVYHWGKMRTVGDSKDHLLTCCQKPPSSPGCVSADAHVWSGLSNATNTVKGFVRTTLHKLGPNRKRIFGLDCEMCYTVEGLELVKVAVVDLQCQEIYHALVHPENEVVDFNTRFSSVTEKDYASTVAKTFRQVQNDIAAIISVDSIVIGHGLENDLRVLKIVHYLVVDTAIIFSHERGITARRSLKELAEVHLKKEVQTDGHNPLEDAKVCIELVLFKLKEDHSVMLRCEK